MSKAGLIGIAGAAILVLGLGYLVLTPSESQKKDRALDTSVIGVEGLVKWLPDRGIRVVRSNPRLNPRTSNLSMQIVPLYDVDLFANAVPAQTKDAEMLQSTQRDLEWWAFSSKLDDLRTLVVLPKWRSGFLKSDVAHSSTLIPLSAMDTLLSNLYLTQGALLRLGPTMTMKSLTMKPGPERSVALYHAQLFRPDALPDQCTPLLGMRQGYLLIRCNGEGGDDLAAAYYLSDPDLINNHGLALAENVSFAVDMISALRAINAPDDKRAVYVDTSTEALLISNDQIDKAQPYERGETEFARFFDYPLSVLWAVAGVILALAGWRGLRRFGPAVRPAQDSPEQSKTVGIDAKARLLRISGNDGRMVGEFVRTRLDALAEAAFGAGSGTAAAPVADRLFKHLARRDAALSAKFRTVSDDLITRGADMPQRELYSHLETFRDLLERLTHGSDPISKPD